MCKTKKIKLLASNEGENSGAIVTNNTGTIVINNGAMLSAEVKRCMHIMIREEFSHYAKQALKEARKRESEFFDAFIERLVEAKLLNTENLRKAFSSPSFQYDCYEAQKGFIKNGTSDLKTTLANLLQKRIKENDNTLQQIALSEAILVAPKLLPSQMATLALAFILGYTRATKICSVKDFQAYCYKEILPLLESTCRKRSEFLHLVFTGCAHNAPIAKKIEEVFRDEYKGLFCNGMTESEILSDRNGLSLLKKYPLIFRRCFSNPLKFQVGIVDEDRFPLLFALLNVSIEDQPLIIQMFMSTRMSANETKECLLQWVPQMSEVFKYWSETEIRLLSLSTVGIVLACEYMNVKMNEEYDISNWI